MSDASGLAVAIETSTRAPSVAIAWRGKKLAATLSDRAPHASDLLPVLERLLMEVGASPRAIECVIVGTGPGSYTGVRVGVATALGLVRGSGARMRGEPSTEALAWGELGIGETGCVLLDARSNELYFASYRRDADELATLRAACITTRAELPSLLDGRARLFAHDDALRAAGLEARSDLRIERIAVPRAQHLLELGLRRLERDGPQDPASITPLYLRAFAAQSRRR